MKSSHLTRRELFKVAAGITGATLAAASSALRKAGVGEVVCFAIAGTATASQSRNPAESS